MNQPAKPLPDGSWVAAKSNGHYRYVTRQNPRRPECFEDDGEKSKQEPSPFCYYDNYTPLTTAL